MKAVCHPGYPHNGLLATCTSCAQVDESSQSYCGDKWEGTLFS